MKNKIKQCNNQSKSNKDLIELLILTAFEYGRNYEQLYLDLDLYNIINFDDVIFAKEKGASIKSFDIQNVEKIFKCKITTDIEKRKLRRMLEIKDKLNKLSDFYY